jgi:class 3 adenylate cyclase/CHASE1-domain containing sensor protein
MAAGVRFFELSRQQYLLLSGLLFIEAVFTTILGRTIKSKEEQIHRKIFESQAKEVIASVQRQVSVNLEKLVSLEAFYDVVYPVSKEDFSTFARHLVSENSSIKGLEWAPRVKQEDKEHFQENSSEQGFKGFRIAEKVDGNLTEVLKRPEYFPVYYVEPLKGNEAAIGFDLASNRVRSDAMYKAKTSGRMTATEPITLVQENHSEKGVIVFYPFHQNGQLAGYLTGVFRICDLVTKSCGDFTDKDFELVVSDPLADDGNRLLARLGSPGTGTDSAYNKKEHAKELAYREKIKVADREWMMEITPKKSYMDLASSTYLLVLLLCIAISIGLCYQLIQYFKSENLLLNILPVEVAKELKRNGRAEARDFERVSILFTDFIHFTRTAADMSAQSLVHEVNECYEAFDRIVERFGIEKIKTIGDAYMAAGGIPVSTGSDVKNTVLAALEMQKFVHLRKAENKRAGKPVFEMRAGIHTGEVVAGIVGRNKFQYDVWGDTVNTANRLETKGATGKVNISQTTYELLREDPDFVFEYRGKVRTKGKGYYRMWFVG